MDHIRECSYRGGLPKGQGIIIMINKQLDIDSILDYEKLQKLYLEKEQELEELRKYKEMKEKRENDILDDEWKTSYHHDDENDEGDPGLSIIDDEYKLSKKKKLKRKRDDREKEDEVDEVEEEEDHPKKKEKKGAVRVCSACCKEKDIDDFTITGRTRTKCYDCIKQENRERNRNKRNAKKDENDNKNDSGNV